MKKENIDGYEVYSENGQLIKIIFKDILGKEFCVGIGKKVEEELVRRRREGYSEEHKIRKNIDTYVNDDFLLEIKTSNIIKNPEEIIIANEKFTRIIREIWRLPDPQNRRVYMKIVSGFSLTEISKIENRHKSVIKRSIDAGIKKLQKKLKNF